MSAADVPFLLLKINKSHFVFLKWTNNIVLLKNPGVMSENLLLRLLTPIAFSKREFSRANTGGRNC